MKRKNRHTSRRILAFILVVAMMFDMIPFESFTMEVKAAGDDYVITEVPVVDRGQQNNWAATENYDSLVDGDTSTKYGLSNAEPYVEFHYSSAFVPKGYILWTGNDCNGRNPDSWVIKAMNQGDEDWTTLDTVNNTSGDQLPNTISTSKAFSIQNTSAYQYYRFEAVRNSGSHGFELAEIQFIVDPSDLVNCTISGLNDIYQYNGGAAIPVSYEIHAVDGTVLTNSDYTAVFKNAQNQTVNTITATGIYSLVITGKGSYSGTRSFAFKVLDYLSGNGTAGSPYIIADEDDWIQFADENNSDVYWADDVYIKLNTDISTTDMVGSDTNRFKGTFDGAGHTLTIDYTVTQDVCAPFRYVEDATIKNLTVNGSVTNSNIQNAGLVGFSYGTTEILRCVVNAVITCNYNDDSYNGGFVSEEKSGSLNIKNCVFYGSLKGSSSERNGGFLGNRADGQVSFTNCLFSPSEITMSTWFSYTFGVNCSSGASFTNCYYTRAYNYAQGTETSASGEALAALLGPGWSVVNDKVVPIIDPKDIRASELTGLRDFYRYTGSALDITYSIKDVEGQTLTEDCYTAEFRNAEDQRVDSVITAGSYSLVITGNDPYSGTRRFGFRVLAPLSGNGTEGSPYIIADEDDWILFADENNSDVYWTDDVYIKLDTDISTTEMVGSDTNRFKGTFDGAGHVLTINYTATQDVCAPFRYVEDATIKNLTVNGTVTNSRRQNAGLVGFSYGTTAILRCVVNAVITCNYSDDSFNGGFVSEEKSGSLSIKNCAFYGSLKGSWSEKNGGFLGNRAEGQVSFINCLFSPAELTMSTWYSSTFGVNCSSGASFTNCYYTRAYSTAQGTETSASGDELAVLLGPGWIVVNDKVVPVTDTKDIRTIELTGLQEQYRYTGSALNITYSINDADGQSLTEDCYTAEFRNAEDQKVDSVIAAGLYSLVITGKNPYSGTRRIRFCVLAPLSGNGTAGSPYIIADEDDWIEFTDEEHCETYWADDVYVKLDADISTTEMVGSDTHKYMGTFNGAGHTLTIDFTANEDVCAPFRYVEGAEIKDLTIDGSINNRRRQNAGLVGLSYGTTKISFCVVNASITCSKSGDSSNGGFVADLKSGRLTISNCAFYGSLEGSSSSNNGGFLGWKSGEADTVSFQNCLFSPDELSMGTSGSATFGRNCNSGVSFSDCYYTQVFGDAQGTETDASGEALAALLGDSWNVVNEKAVPHFDPKNLATAEITGVDHYEYTGNTIDLSYGLYDSEAIELTEGVDYSVEIRNANDQIVTELRGTGHYYICFTGIGEYSGSITKEYCVYNCPEGLSVDTDHRMDEAGFYYVNMPVTDEISLALTDTAIVFKVYDNGGKNNNYSNSCNGYLKLTAPEDCLLRISGTVQTESSWDYLKIYDGDSSSAAELLKAHSNTSCTNTAITETTSSGRNVTLYFYSDSSNNYQGLDLVVSIIGEPETYTVSFNANGGTGDPMDDQLFCIGTAQELSECTYTAPDGYRFGGWALSADGEAVYADEEEVCDLTTTKDTTVELFAKWVTIHEHEFTYSVDGATITATCNSTTGDCELENGRASLTIRRPQHTAYGDGKAKAATLEGDTAILGTPTIRYKKGSTGLGDAPLAAGSYTASFTLGNKTASIDYTIDTKTVTITGLSAENKTYDGTTAATVRGTAVLDGKLDADDVGISAGSASFAGADAADNIAVSFSGYTLTGSASANYVLSSQPEAVTANITKRNLTITASDQTIMVGDAIDDSLDQVSITAGDGLVEGHVISEITLTKVNEENGIGTYTGAIAVSNARIMDGATDVSGNYQISYENGDLEIESPYKAQITELPVPATGLEYNGTEQTLLTSGGAADTGAVQYKLDDGNWSDTIPAVKNAGTYTVSYRAKGNEYYAVGIVSSNRISIARKDIRITGLSAKDKIYDGTTDATVSGNAVIEGKCENDELTVSAGTASFATAAPGNGISVRFSGYTLSGADAANYRLTSQPAAVTAAINKRSLTIKAVDQHIGIYGSIDTGLDKISLTSGDGLPDGEEITGITITKVDEDNTVGTHPDAIAASGAVIKRGTADVSAYYRISYENGDLEIIDNGNAEITSQPTAASGLEYNGTEQALLTAGGVANSGAVQYKLDNGNWTDTIPKAKVPGSYTVSYRAKANAYYLEGSVSSCSISIAKKAVSITGLSVENKTYDGTTDASVKGTAVIDGKIENDDLTVSAGTASFATAVPGTGISVSFTGYSLSGEDAAYYTLSAQPAAVTAAINKRSLTITAADQQTGVDGSIATGLDKISLTGGDGLLDGDEIAGITLARVDEDNTVGTHTDAIAASGAVIKRGTTDVSAYYRISYENGDLEIISAEATITKAPVKATALVYNGTEQALLTAGGVANSGTVQYKLDNGNWIDNTIPAVKNAGTYTVSYRAKANAYYQEGSVSSCSITIAKAPLTVTANDNTIIYGDEPSDAGVSYTGFVGGETEAVLDGSLTYEYDYKQYDPRYIGKNSVGYSIIPTGLTSDNYDITYVAGRLNIDKKPVGVVWSDTILTYNGHNQGPVPSLTGLVNNDEVVVNAVGVKRYPGTYIATPVIYDERGNYIIVGEFPCSFTIIKAPSPVEIDEEASVAKSGKSIDLSDHVTMNKATGEVSYTIVGDDRGCRIEGSTFISGSIAGTVSVNIAVEADRCYEAMEAGTIYVKVCDKAQDIAFEEAEVNKTYGDADFTNVLKGAKTAVRYEVTEGSEVASVDENGKLTIKAAGTAVITATAEEDSVYAGAVASYTLTVARKAVTVKAEDKSKKEGEQDPVFTAVIEGLVNGDDESLIAYSISREEGELEGSYAIILSGAEEQGNYSVSYLNAVLTIESVIVEGRKYTINIMTGAVAKNKAGEPVYTANENERISISWTPREGYEFVQWKISGAAAEEAVSANTAFRMGAGDVTVSYEEKLMAAAEVTEEKPAIDESVTVRKVKFAEKKLTLIKQGGIKENRATAEGDANAKIVYVTGNKDIVAVDQSGRFYPVAVGETTVTAYCGNKTASCKVTVVSYTNELIIKDENNDYINDQPVEMKSGEQKFFTVSFEPYDSTDPRTVSWKSDNRKVKVKNGLVTAAEVNEVTEVKLTAEVKTADPDNTAKLISRTVNIRLIPLVTEKASAANKSHTLKLKKTLKLNVTNNKTSELKLTLNAKGDTDITAVKVVAESSNPSVVSVNALTEGGTEGNKRNVAVRLEAGKAGTAYIIVKTYSPGSSEPNVKRCKVSVTKPASAIVVKSGTLNVSYKNIEMRKGQNGTIEVSLDPAFSTDAGKLKLSAKGGVKLKNGIIYAVKAKEGKIIVKCGKLKEVITVTVKE